MKKSGKKLLLVLCFIILAGATSSNLRAQSWVTSGSNIYYNSGNVGVGTTSPDYLMLLSSYTSWSNSLAVGSNYYGDVYKFLVNGGPGGLLFKPVGKVPTSPNPNYAFRSSFDANLVEIYNDGHVNIGTPVGTGSYLLNVAGRVRANEIVVNTSGADFVFEGNYNLRNLVEVENYIKENKHLPEIPSAGDMQSDGMSLGDMQTKLLQKVEELTLYLIELKKENAELNTRLKQLEDSRNTK